MVSVKPNISHWNCLTSSCPTETISQHRAVIFGHALPPPVKTRRSFPPGEDQRIDKWNEEGKTFYSKNEYEKNEG